MGEQTKGGRAAGGAGARGGGAPRFEPAIAADSPQFRFHHRARSVLSWPGACHLVDSKVPLVTFFWVRESEVSVEKEDLERMQKHKNCKK